MKKLALIMMFSVTGVVLNAEEYTIQTISTLKESSITPAFEKKVEKTALHMTKKKEGECNIVTVGNYKNVKEANVDLKKAKAIAKDAFVRPLVRTTPKVCETHTAAAKVLGVENKGEKSIAASAQKTSVKNEEAIAAVHEAITPSATVTAADTHTGTVMPSQETKAEPYKAQASNNTPVFVYDRNLARKSDIQEAIEYYKRSPYYSFKPILTLR